MHQILFLCAIIGVVALFLRLAVRLNRKQEDDILGKI